MYLALAMHEYAIAMSDVTKCINIFFGLYGPILAEAGFGVLTFRNIAGTPIDRNALPTKHVYPA